MTRVKLLPTSIFVLLAMPTIFLAAAGCSAGQNQHKTIVVYGFSVLDHVIKQEIVPAFQDDWKQRTGQDVQVITSFAGSGTITNQLAFGARGDIALLSTELDAQSLKSSGLITTDWTQFKDRGTFAYSVTVIVTRAGNPKSIYSFEDLAQEHLEVIYPDPTTSGGAQWAVLALYGSALKASELATGAPDYTRARELLKEVNRNTGSLPESARGALGLFALGYGDALLTYENEALLDISKGKGYVVIVPPSTIYIEPKALIVDRNVAPDEREVVSAFVEFLWSKEAQRALARNYFRVSDEEVMAEYAQVFQPVRSPFTVDDLGGWEEATSRIIDQAWRQVQREMK